MKSPFKNSGNSWGKGGHHRPPWNGKSWGVGGANQRVFHGGYGYFLEPYNLSEYEMCEGK